jgi:predicted nucleic-acid-binding Zn-ribbon protein
VAILPQGTIIELVNISENLLFYSNGIGTISKFIDAKKNKLTVIDVLYCGDALFYQKCHGSRF